MTSVIPLRLRLAGGVAGNPPVNTVLPVVTGTLNEGDTLTTTTGTWIGDPTIIYTYQWYYTPGTAITGKTTSTYIIQVGDAGASVFCKVTATNSVGAVSANSTAVGPVTVAGGTYAGFAATSGRMPTHVSGSTAVNTRSGHWARTNITQLKILCPNYYEGGEIAPGGATTITASVEYPAGTMTQLKFSTSTSGTIPNGGQLVSDYVTLPGSGIPNGDRFWIRTHQANATGLVYTSNTDVAHQTTMMGDRYEITATDHTMSGVIIDEQQSSYYPGIIAPMTAPSVLILGASIATGVTDAYDLSGDLGIIARSIGPYFGYYAPCMPGETAVTFVAGHTNRVAAAAYCTYVYSDYGYNDIFGGRTAAQIEADLTTIYGYFSTKTVNQLTNCPRSTDPSNTWSTTTGQTVVAGYGPPTSVRATLNADMRAHTFQPGGGISDVGSILEYSPPSGLYLAGKTIDGIHPNNSGYLDIAATGAVNRTLIGTPATPATETGSAWGDHKKITISTRRRANDTAAPNTLSNPSTTVRGAASNSSGLKYFEIELIGDQISGFTLGLMTNATANGSALDDYMGDITDSFGITNGAAYAFVSGTIFSPTSVGALTNLMGAGDVYGMAVDFTNKYAYLHRNGTYFTAFGGAVGVPTSGSSGTGNVCHWTGTPTLYPGMTLYGFVDTLTAKPVRLRTAQFLYAPPSGYSAWG